MADEKFLDKKMDRREFLKKAGIGGAGLALGLSGAVSYTHLDVYKRQFITWKSISIDTWSIKDLAEVNLST